MYSQNLRCAIKHQLIFMKYYKTYHVDLIYIIRSGVGSSFCTRETCLVFRKYLAVVCIMITDIWWDISNSYMAARWSAFLWIFQESYIDIILFEKLGEAETHRLSLLIQHSYAFWRTVSYIQANANHHLFLIRIPFLLLAPDSGPFCLEDPCSGCNSVVNLVFTQYTFLGSEIVSEKAIKTVLLSFYPTTVKLALLVIAWCELFKAVFVEHTCYSNVVSSKVGKQTKSCEIVFYKYMITNSSR